MNDDGIDAGRLRREVRDKYRDVALRPESTFDFYTGRPLAERLGYPRSIVDALPTVPSNPSRALATRSPSVGYSPAITFSTSAPAPDSTRWSPPARSAPAVT
jgi:hypothetical protein